MAEPTNATNQDRTRVAIRLAGIQRIVLVVGLGLVLIGAAIELARRGHVGEHAVSLTSLPSELVTLRGGALLSLGLVVLLVAPASGLVYLVGAFVRARDWLHAAIAAVVLAILIASVLLRGLA